MAKKTKVAKVSLETGVSEDALNRLSLEALDKIDQLVVDIDPILVDEDLLSAPVKEKKMVGYHMITGLEIWE